MGKEAFRLKTLQNEHIVNYIEHFDTDGFIIIMELCEFGDLDNQINLMKEKGSHFAEAEILVCLGQVCKALVKSHGFEVIHGDIKPQNLFVKKDNTIKVGDFGVALIASAFQTQK
jgi:serine/threonine protein kinase